MHTREKRGLGFLFYIRSMHRLQHFTAFADIHLLAPVFLRLALVNRSVDEPAEMPRLELPCCPGSAIDHNWSGSKLRIQCLVLRKRRNAAHKSGDRHQNKVRFVRCASF
jgi:hypothetical protein